MKISLFEWAEPIIWNLDLFSDNGLNDLLYDDKYIPSAPRLFASFKLLATKKSIDPNLHFFLNLIKSIFFSLFFLFR